MRVLILTFEHPPETGGIGRYVEEISKSMHASGIEVLTMALCGSVSLEEVEAFDRAFPLKIVRFRKMNRCFSVLERFISASMACQSFKPDLVFACQDGAVVIAAFLKLILGVPYLVMGHGSEFLYKGRPFYKLSYQSADAYLANSRYTASIMADYIGISKELITVIPLGANVALFNQRNAGNTRARRAKLGIDPGRFVLLTVGRVSFRKAQDLTLRSLVRLNEAGLYPVYLVVGDGPEMHLYKDLARDLGLSDSVFFIGRVKDEELPGYYAMADLFIFASRQTEESVEGFGISVIESNLMGVPAVGTRCSGIEDAIDDGVSGVLIDPESVDSLVCAIRKLMVNEVELSQMSEKAQERAVAGFSWERVGDETCSAIKRLMNSV